MSKYSVKLQYKIILGHVLLIVFSRKVCLPYIEYCVNSSINFKCMKCIRVYIYVYIKKEYSLKWLQMSNMFCLYMFVLQGYTSITIFPKLFNQQAMYITVYIVYIFFLPYKEPLQRYFGSLCNIFQTDVIDVLLGTKSYFCILIRYQKVMILVSHCQNDVFWEILVISYFFTLKLSREFVICDI